MKTLTDVYGKMNESDQVLLEKLAQEKLAEEEEDAAGRIMARGFANELQKIAQDMGGGNFGGPTETIKSPPMSTGGATGGNVGMKKKPLVAPPAPAQATGAGKGTAGPGGTFNQGGQKFDATTSAKTR